MSQNRRTSNLLGGLGGMAKAVGTGVSQVGTGVMQGTRVVGNILEYPFFSWNQFHEIFVKLISRKNFFCYWFSYDEYDFFWYLIRLHIRDGKGNIDFYLTFHEKRWCMRVTLTFWHNNKALKIAKMQRSKA